MAVPQTIAPGGHCSMPFTFNPPAGRAPQTVTADSLSTPPLVVLVNSVPPAKDIPFALSASGTIGTAAADGPAVTLSPNPMNFGAPLGVAQTFLLTIKNSGNSDLSVLNVHFVGGTLGFTFVDGNPDASLRAACVGSPIPKGQSCFLSVTFTPATTGSVTTSLVIVDNTAAGQHTATLNGIGLGPVVSLDKTTLRMLAANGGASPISTVTLTNIGTDDLRISAISDLNALTGFSRRSENCLGASVGHPSGKCSLDFNFTATAALPYNTATVTITDNAIPSTQTITLTGGISGAAIFVSGPAVNSTDAFLKPCGFCVPLETNINTPVSTTISLTNVGTVDVTIQDIALTKSGTGFAITDKTACFAKLLHASPAAGQAGDSCTFPITFNPASTGTPTNSITVSTNIPPPSTISIGLNGVAVDAPVVPPHDICQDLAPGEICIKPHVAYTTLSVAATTDPIDGGTGQLYEEDLDLTLGGPLNLQFVRYYASGLSSGGYKSSFGVNWMSNFDLAMTLNNNTAEVLLFRGKIVTFSKAGGLWTLVSPLHIRYQFATSGSGYQFMSPVSSLVYTFNSVGTLAGIADLKGNVLTVTQGPSGPVTISDGLGRTLTLTYAGSRLAGVQDQAGRSVSYSYTGANLTSATDALKKTTGYTYVTSGSLAGLMTKKQLPAGNIPTMQTYDASGRVIAQTDGSGNATRIGYDGKGGTTITGAMGDVTQQGNNASGALSKLTDASGNSLNVAFDNAEHRAGFTAKMGNAVRFTYHAPTGNLESRTDELGNTTTYAFTARTLVGFTFYDLTGIAFPDGTSNSMSYDANGNLISRTAADGTTATKTYDNRGQILESIDANNQSTSFAFNSDGTLASRQDPLGNTSTYSYTAAGQPSKFNNPDGGVSAFTYDANGQLLTVTDPAGAISSNRYDDNGQRVAVTNRDGGIFGFTYSPTGRLTSITDPLGNKTAFAYDAEDRQASATDAAGETISRTYDLVGHLMSLSDNRGVRVSYAYDVEGRIVSQTDPMGKVTSFGYDPTGQLTSSVKPDGTGYTFAYDKLGRLMSLANSLGETQSVKRDAMGRVTQVNLPGNIASAVQFDTLGRTAAITSPNGNTWTVSNDALGRISSITDPLGVATSRSYTGTWLTGMTLPLGTLSVTHDKNGRVTGRQYSDGTGTSMTYNPSGLLTSADGLTIKRDVMGHPVDLNGIALTYTSAGRLATLTYAPGKTVTYAYDNAGRFGSVRDWVGGQTTFTYDAASRLAGLTYPNGVATTYAFDANDRLSGIAAGSLASIALTRDAAGRITSADRNLPAAPALQSSSQQFSYNAAAQMNGETFDAMGRAITETGRAYTWNLASQLTGFQDSVNSGGAYL